MLSGYNISLFALRKICIIIVLLAAMLVVLMRLLIALVVTKCLALFNLLFLGHFYDLSEYLLRQQE